MLDKVAFLQSAAPTQSAAAQSATATQSATPSKASTIPSKAAFCNSLLQAIVLFLCAFCHINIFKFIFGALPALLQSIASQRRCLLCCSPPPPSPPPPRHDTSVLQPCSICKSFWLLHVTYYLGSCCDINMLCWLQSPTFTATSKVYLGLHALAAHVGAFTQVGVKLQCFSSATLALWYQFNAIAAVRRHPPVHHRHPVRPLLQGKRHALHAALCSSLLPGCHFVSVHKMLSP